MSEFARVTSIEALKDFRADLCTFAEQAQESLASVQMAAQRTLDWLEEQGKYWQREVRRWEDAVAQARTELARRKLMRIGDRAPDCTEQEKILRDARLRLDEAEDKLARTQRWLPAFRRALDEYHGPARQLAGFLEGEQPRALALLALKIDSLEEYVRLTAPPGG
jgi:hypothetical protein